jgi:diacylglycerol O-acyltransferase
MLQLTGLDAAFLAMETPAVFGHVGSLCIIDPSTATGPLDLAGLTGIIQSRLHLIPPFRRRLVGVPLGLDQPYWIDDADFDVEYHVRELALPCPGDDHQLREQVARLHARALDRRRPLWELYLLHGLEGGRKGIYTKVHHSAIDGVSGNDILAALLDVSPAGRQIDPAPPWVGETAPGPGALLARSALSLAWNPVRAARIGYGLARSLPRMAASPVRPRLPLVDRLTGRDARVTLDGPRLRAPSTPFNRSITPHRRWSFISLPLDEVKVIKNTVGVTVNDVVMALCTGALRRWLLDHDALPDEPLVAAVPVSVRTDDQKGGYGNRVSIMFAALPTNLPDPGERLGAVHDAMSVAKDLHGAVPADLLADVTEFAMPALAGQANRLSARLKLLERLSPFNLIISNIPGPNVPLYYAGARLLAYYPISALTDGQGLNMTVMSYGGQLHFGLIACRELVPDIENLAVYLDQELELLAGAVAGAKVAAE